MQSVARLAQATGRAALPVVGASVAAAVTPGPGTAYADAPAALDLSVGLADWEFADLRDKSVVLFSPADIDSAVSLLTKPHCAPAIEDLDSESSNGSVDEVIECASYRAAGTADSSFGFDNKLFSVAARLLKAPGVQQEMVKAALTDPEVFDILAEKIDLPGYLGVQGLAAHGLLPSNDPAGTASSTLQLTPGAARDASGSGSSSGVLEDLSSWAADRVESMGYAVVRLARWMRAKVTGQQQGAEAGDGAGAAGERPFMRGVGGTVLVVVAMVAIVAVMLVRKPVLLRRMASVARAMAR